MTARFRRHADIRLTALEGEGVVLHLGSRSYFTVTETGLTILDAIAEPKTFDQLVDTITTEYDVDRPKATTSVRTFLDRCLESALVVELA